MAGIPAAVDRTAIHANSLCSTVDLSRSFPTKTVRPWRLPVGPLALKKPVALKKHTFREESTLSYAIVSVPHEALRTDGPRESKDPQSSISPGIVHFPMAFARRPAGAQEAGGAQEAHLSGEIYA